MNPLADVVALPVWQFLLVYSAVALFAAVFLVYVRWESCQVEEVAASDPAPADADELARGRTAPHSPATLARLMELKLIVAPAALWRMRALVAAATALFLAVAGYKLGMTLDRGKPVTGLVLAVAGTLAGGLALGLPPLWMTSRGAAALAKRRRS